MKPEQPERLTTEFGLAFPNSETARMVVFLRGESVRIRFGDPLPEQITPPVAAELAERLRAAVPEIIKLGARLRRHGGQ